MGERGDSPALFHPKILAPSKGNIFPTHPFIIISPSPA